MDKDLESLGNRIWRFFVAGPPRPAVRARWFDTLFPWPMPVLAVVVAYLIGLQWDKSVLGEQLGSALQYGALIAVSIVVSCWFWIALANVALALTLFLPHVESPGASPWLTLIDYTEHGLAFANRQLGHIVTLLVWSVLAIVGADGLPGKLALLVAVWALGPPLINQLASWIGRVRAWLFPPREGHAPLDLNLQRRPLFFWAPLVGFGLLALLAPHQWFKLLPGILAFTLADGVRYVWHWRFKRAIAPGSPKRDHLLGRHERQMSLAARWDVLAGPVTGLGIMGALLAANSIGHSAYDKSLAGRTTAIPVDYCATTSPPAPEPDLAMFLLADSHFHELAGRRFIGQMAFAEAVESVALRPVELDVLAPATLWRLGSLYRDLAKQRGGSLPWAHLGDLADLACKHELYSAENLLHARFEPAQFAGVAPGSHDKVFAGNFFWSPFWDTACVSQRLEKQGSDQKLFDDWNARVSDRKGQMRQVPPPRVLGLRGGALIGASPLGLVHDGKQRRGVLGVFLDSADGQAVDLGLSGALGAFSAAQAEAATRLLDDVKAGAGSDYQDPFYLVFVHNPLDDLRWLSGRRIHAWLAALDKNGPRLIGLLSGHTHTAAAHAHCIGKRSIPEIVIGSTLDPPQEAALLQLGPAPDGVLTLRVQTIPTVARAGMTCPSTPLSVSAVECQKVMAKLRDEASCRALFAPPAANRPSRECSDIEHPLDAQELMRQVIQWTGPSDEEEIRKNQRQRLQALWSCVCRSGGKSPRACAAEVPAMATPEGFFDDEVNLRLVWQELARADPDTERELTCLGWAAAVVQQHKLAGMTFTDALRCGFDTETLPPAHDYIARMEDNPCY
jgi:hypothetical protein